jgi:cytochrome c-type biogenesis protein
MNVTIAAALAAGMLSFLSPCVLPLVPPYLVYLAGASLERLAGEEAPPQVRRETILAALLFVLGFTTVFVALGASASAVGSLLREYSYVLGKVAGVIIIVMGLHFLGVTPIAWFMREKRVAVAKPVGLWGAYVMGLAFAFGWTPCIGPILAAVLVLAANTQTISRGVFLLAIYSAGLAVPFLLTAIGINQFLRFYQKFRRHLHTVEVLSGVLLLFVGGLIFLNRLTWLSGKLGFLNKFSL